MGTPPTLPKELAKSGSPVDAQPGLLGKQLTDDCKSPKLLSDTDISTTQEGLEKAL